MKILLMLSLLVGFSSEVFAKTCRCKYVLGNDWNSLNLWEVNIGEHSGSDNKCRDRCVDNVNLSQQYGGKVAICNGIKANKLNEIKSTMTQILNAIPGSNPDKSASYTINLVARAGASGDSVAGSLACGNVTAKNENKCPYGAQGEYWLDGTKTKCMTSGNAQDIAAMAQNSNTNEDFFAKFKDAQYVIWQKGVFKVSPLPVKKELTVTFSY